MITGWVELIRKPFAKPSEFVSVDARRFSASHNIKNYEMMTSPPSHASRELKEPPSAILSSNTDYFGKEVQYVSPTLSFSTPRPPSAGREWDPTSTHAKPSVTRHGSFPKIYE